MADDTITAGRARLVVKGGISVPLGAAADAATNLVGLGRLAAVISGVRPLTFSIVDARMGSISFDLVTPDHVSAAVELGRPTVQAAREAIREVAAFLAGDLGEALANIVTVLAFLEVISSKRSLGKPTSEAVFSAAHREMSAAALVPPAILEQALNDNVLEGVNLLLSEPKARLAVVEMERTSAELETSLGKVQLDGSVAKLIYEPFGPREDAAASRCAALVIVAEIDVGPSDLEPSECVIHGMEVGSAEVRRVFCSDARFSAFAARENLAGAVLDCVCAQYFAIQGVAIVRSIQVTEVTAYRFPHSLGWLEVPEGTLVDA